MRIKLWEDGVMLFDTNDVADNIPKALQGGRLGVYFLSATKQSIPSLITVERMNKIFHN